MKTAAVVQIGIVLVAWTSLWLLGGGATWRPSIRAGSLEQAWQASFWPLALIVLAGAPPVVAIAIFKSRHGGTKSRAAGLLSLLLVAAWVVIVAASTVYGIRRFPSAPISLRVIGLAAMLLIILMEWIAFEVSWQFGAARAIAVALGVASGGVLALATLFAILVV